MGSVRDTISRAVASASALARIAPIIALGAWPAVAAPAEAVPAELALERVADGVWVHLGRHEDLHAGNGGDVANLGVVVGEASVAVIDAGASHRIARALGAAVARITDRPISHLVLTHAHPDHALGAGAFAGVGEVVAHARFARAFGARADASRPRYAFALEPGVPTALDPTVELAPGETRRIDLGGRTLLAIALPSAHTDHDLAILDEATGTLFASDLAFEGRLPSLDGHLLGWLDALDALASLEPALVVPGHGAPGGWDETVGAQRAYLEALVDDVRLRVARGDTLAEVVAEAEAAGLPGAPHDSGGRAAAIGRGAALFALQHPTNVTRAFVELEWE